MTIPVDIHIHLDTPFTAEAMTDTQLNYSVIRLSGTGSTTPSIKIFFKPNAERTSELARILMELSP